MDKNRPQGRETYTTGTGEETGGESGTEAGGESGSESGEEAGGESGTEPGTESGTESGEEAGGETKPDKPSKPSKPGSKPDSKPEEGTEPTEGGEGTEPAEGGEETKPAEGGEDSGETPPPPPPAEEETGDSPITAGESYIIVVNSDHAIGSDGSAVPYNGEQTEDMIWKAEAGGKDGVYRFTNAAGKYLTFSGEKGAGVSVAAGDTNSSWEFKDDTFGYTNRGKVAEYISGIDGTTVTLGAEAAAVEVIPAEAAEEPGDDPGDEPGDEPGDDPGDEPGTEPGETGKEFTKTDTVASGQNFVIVIEQDSKNLAIAAEGDGFTAKEVEVTDGKIIDPDPSVVWAAATGKGGGFMYSCGSVKFNTDEATLVNPGKKDNSWQYKDGSLGYTSSGVLTGYISEFADGAIKVAASPVNTVSLYTDGTAAPAEEPGDEPGGSTGAEEFKDWKGPMDLKEGYKIAMRLGEVTLNFGPGGKVETAPAIVKDEIMDASKSALVVKALETGVALYVNNPDGKLEGYLVVNDDGTVALSKDESAGYWIISEGGGPTSVTYVYHVGDAVWNLTLDENGQIVGTTDKPKKGDLFSPNAPEGPGGPGGGPGGGPKVDEKAPVVTEQPASIPFVIEGSEYPVPEYSVKVALPEGLEAANIYIQWYIAGEPVGEPEVTENATTAASTLKAEQLANQKVGVYGVYAKAWTVEVGEDGKETEHSVDSFTVNFIVAKGVLENSVLTFSDVHETWDHVGTAIYDTILAKDGLIPALIIATGDYNNKYVAGANDSGAEDSMFDKCIENMIKRISLQAAGIDTVWVSGNHDNGYATGFTNANIQAGLGVDLENYQDLDKAITGTGIIFDSRNAEKAETSKSIENGLIVIGVNYEDAGAAQGAYEGSTSGRPADPSKLDYGDENSPENSVYHHIKAALENVAADYNGELVIISTHSGLHTLGVDPSSAASGTKEWSGGQDYSVNNSAAVVKMINSFAEDYGMDILFLFGHDHSKGEREFCKLPGETIISTVNYEEQVSEPIELKFTYAHSGYITNTINGVEIYSLLTWDENTVTRYANVADGKQSKNDDLTFTLDRTELIKIGDVNGDGTIDRKDRIILARYLAKWPGVEIVEEAADVNGDGTVDRKDRIVLARFLANWPDVTVSGVVPAPKAPAEEKPAEEKPAEPAPEEKPAEEKPAEPAPIEEKPAA